MNIAFIVKRYDTVGGTEKDLYELSHRLADYGHEVHIYCLEARTEPPAGIKIHRLPVLGLGRTAKLWSLAILGPQKAYGGGHEIVVSFGRVLRQDLIRCGGGSHKVFLQRMAETEGFFRRIFKGLSLYHNSLLFIERRQFNVVNYRKVLAISEVVKKECIEVFGTPAHDIEVIYDGIDTDLFNPANRNKYREDVRREFGIPKGSVLCLFLGNGFKRKGLDSLLKALSILKGKDIFCLVVGSDSDMDRYKTVAVSLGMGKNIVFAGRQNRPERFYAAADFFVLPSLQEAFGNALLEAMACALPVITSRVAGASEILIDGLERFVLKDPHDTDNLAVLINELLDPSLRDILAEKARRIAEGYTLEKNAKAIEELCKKVLNEKKSCLNS